MGLQSDALQRCRCIRNPHGNPATLVQPRCKGSMGRQAGTLALTRPALPPPHIPAAPPLPHSTHPPPRCLPPRCIPYLTHQPPSVTNPFLLSPPLAFPPLPLSQRQGHAHHQAARVVRQPAGALRGALPAGAQRRSQAAAAGGAAARLTGRSGGAQELYACTKLMLLKG